MSSIVIGKTTQSAQCCNAPHLIVPSVGCDSSSVFTADSASLPPSDPSAPFAASTSNDPSAPTTPNAPNAVSAPNDPSAPPTPPTAVVSTKRASRAMCSSCGTAEYKYKCPACLTLSCSLQCTRKHKELNKCSGVRNPAKKVEKCDMDDEMLQSDFRFLEEVRSKLEERFRNTKVHHLQQDSSYKNFRGRRYNRGRRGWHSGTPNRQNKDINCTDGRGQTAQGSNSWNQITEDEGSVRSGWNNDSLQNQSTNGRLTGANRQQQMIQNESRGGWNNTAVDRCQTSSYRTRGGWETGDNRQGRTMQHRGGMNRGSFFQQHQTSQDRYFGPPESGAIQSNGNNFKQEQINDNEFGHHYQKHSDSQTRHYHQNHSNEQNTNKFNNSHKPQNINSRFQHPQSKPWQFKHNEWNAPHSKRPQFEPWLEESSSVELFRNDIPGDLKKLRFEARQRHIQLLLMPRDMSRRCRNTSSYDEHEKTIRWHVRVVFVHANVYLEDNVEESTSLGRIICKFLNTPPEQLRGWPVVAATSSVTTGVAATKRGIDGSAENVAGSPEKVAIEGDKISFESVIDDGTVTGAENVVMGQAESLSESAVLINKASVSMGCGLSLDNEQVTSNKRMKLVPSHKGITTPLNSFCELQDTSDEITYCKKLVQDITPANTVLPAKSLSEEQVCEILHYKAAGIAGLAVLFRNERFTNRTNQYEHLDVAESLCESLYGLQVVEFPILLVVRKDHVYGYLDDDLCQQHSVLSDLMNSDKADNTSLNNHRVVKKEMSLEEKPSAGKMKYFDAECDSDNE